VSHAGDASACPAPVPEHPAIIRSSAGHRERVEAQAGGRVPAEYQPPGQHLVNLVREPAEHVDFGNAQAERDDVGPRPGAIPRRNDPVEDQPRANRAEEAPAGHRQRPRRALSPIHPELRARVEARPARPMNVASHTPNQRLPKTPYSGMTAEPRRLARSTRRRGTR
jgi:hypothetical protein